MKLHIYGDSILKMVYPDVTGRYRSLAGQYEQRAREEFGIAIENRAHFGYTSARGLQLLERDLSRGLSCTHALLGYGGNDSDYDWDAISRDPTGEYAAKESIAGFRENMKRMVQLLRSAGVQPMLMDLPPVHGERYFETLSHRGERSPERILSWLGETAVISRVQEAYSLAVTCLAGELDLPLVEIRSGFLTTRDYPALMSQDGIHPSPKGYELLYRQLCAQLRGIALAPAA